MLLQHRVLVPTTDTRPTAVRTFFESTTDVMVFSCYVAGVVPAHAGVLSLRRERPCCRRAADGPPDCRD